MKFSFKEDTGFVPEHYHYTLEQMMLSLFPGEKPLYGDITPEDESWAYVNAREDDRFHVTIELCYRGQMGSYGVGVPLSGDEYAREGQRRRAIGACFFRAAHGATGITPPWGMLSGVRPVKLPTRELKAGASPEQARRMMEEALFVSTVRAELAVDCARASVAVDESLGPNEVSIYVGIPFCPTRCSYCSFVSSDVHKSLKLIQPYLELVYEEIDATAAALKEAGLTVRSFYMGGGTPTTLTAQQMDALLTKCEQALPLGACTEFTVEAGRPDTITREKLEVLKRHNIGRISINPQTLSDQVLAAIGRRHTGEDIRKAYQLAREVGFECINMDLIAGLPRDDFEGFKASLDGVLAMDPENVTVHTLALKKGSSLMEQGGAIPSGEEVARMLEYSLNTLRDNGLVPYYLYRQKYMSGALENVGWSKPGTESLYNIVMMEELHTVISIGGGGVTKLVDTKAGKILRLPNPKYPHDYLAMREKILAQKKEIVAFYR